MGEDQFRGVQVYDVIQDQELNYWFATNEGLYLYDHYNYKKINCDAARTSSVFNFVMDKEGVIYCHNLNKQVFRLKNGECNIFYELGEQESSSDISLTIGEKDELVIGAGKIIVLDKKGKALLRYQISGHYLGPAFLVGRRGIQFHLGGSDSVLVYSNGGVSKQLLRSFPTAKNDPGILKFFSVGDTSYAIDLKNKNIFRYMPEMSELAPLPKNPIFERSGSVRIYETATGLWVAGTLPGVVLLGNDLGRSNKVLYSDFFISNVYRDKEGNTLLCTFDKGVLVIPDLAVPDVINSFRDDPVTALYVDKDMGLLLGSSRGNLINYSGAEFRALNGAGTRPIVGIYGDSESKLILFDDGYIRAYNKETGTLVNVLSLSLKDAAFVSPAEFYIGTNIGVVKCGWKRGEPVRTEPVKGLNFRVYSLEYSPTDKLLYAATSNGMFAMDSSGASRKVKYLEQDIFPLDLHYNDGTLFISTLKDGILVMKHNRVEAAILPAVSGKTEALDKVRIYQKNILAKSSNGLFLFDSKGKLLASLHNSFGFSTHRVIDFTSGGKYLWVSHSGGVQQIDPAYSGKNLSEPLIRLTMVQVNDEAIAPEPQNRFNSQQRKIQFTLSSPTLRNRGTIHYYYRLLGYDRKWNVSNYQSNKITYNALAPGNYTLQVRAEDRGVFSKPVTYSFSIDQPFYSRWWFILLMVSGFLGIVFGVYRWQINIQRKKMRQINELNASKLAAIQSQMNPHFIFNSLNSIQDLVLKGDVEYSYSYITTFSNLVRRTLSYSEKEFIDFEQEIKLLELYLSLEKLRFKKDLEYTIEVRNMDDIMLPPLLIQPFIENALVHGLLHKEGEKKLKICFELRDMLVCTIEDNGIGRDKAKAIKQRQRAEHESFSGKAIRNRFEILSNVFKGEFGYAYEDLYRNDEPVGTRVILTIPVKHKF